MIPKGHAKSRNRPRAVRSVDDDPDEAQLVTAKQVRGLLGGVSEMHMWRLVCDEHYRGLKFPKPIKINRRNYFRLREVRAWIAQQDAASRCEAA